MRSFACLLVVAVMRCVTLGAETDRAQEAFNVLHSSLSRGEAVTDLGFDARLKREMRAYGWQLCVEHPEDSKAYWLVLAFLSDPEARALIVNELAGKPSQPVAWELAHSGIPILLPDLAPVMFRAENWENLGAGGDVGYYPESFDMAALIVSLLAHSAYFKPEVRSWARRFGDSPGVYDTSRANEMRDIMRKWWKANEKFVRSGNYAAVKAGRNPTPLPEPHVPVSVPMGASAPTLVPAPPQVAVTALANPAARTSEHQTANSGGKAAEILKLLPLGMDMPGDNEVANVRRLEAMGEKAYPVLADEMLRTDDPYRIGNILAIMEAGSADKTIPRLAVRRLLQRRNGTENPQVLALMGAHTLLKIGTADDTDLMIKLLDEPSPAIKRSALQTLGKIAGARSREFIKNWQKTRSKVYNDPAEREIDVEADRAVLAIALRLKNKP